MSGAVVAARARKEARTRRVFIDAPKKEIQSGEEIKVLSQSRKRGCRVEPAASEANASEKPTQKLMRAEN
jgi:hypothetical protein